MQRSIVRRRGGLAILATTTALLLGGAPAPAVALDDGQQLLIGGNSGSASGTRFTAPGLANIYNADFPDTGLGEAAAQIRMVAGTVGKFRANILTQGNATSGSVTLTVRVNGVDTDLTCSVGKDGGDCGSGGKAIAILNGDKLAVRIASTLDQGFWTFTFTMTYD